MKAPKGKIKLAFAKPHYYTLWAPLPDAVLDALESELAEIAPYCLDVAGRSAKEWYRPHITLRYFGLASSGLKAQVLADATRFKKLLEQALPVSVTMRGFTLFEDGVGQLRLSWNVVDERPLAELHQALQKIHGYAGYPEIQGKNYHPHVIVAKANMQIPDIRGVLEAFIAKNGQLAPVTATINTAALHFVDPIIGADRTESSELPLVS